MTQIDLLTETAPPSISAAGFTVNSNTEPLLIAEQTTYLSPTTTSAGAYDSGREAVQAANSINLPRIIRSAFANTAFSLFNTASSAANVSITYYDTNGNLIF